MNRISNISNQEGDFRKFVNDFRGGFNEGYSILSGTNKALQQGVEGLHKLNNLAEHISSIPLLNDAFDLAVTDDPLFLELLGQADIAAEVFGDVTKTLGDLNAVLQTGSLKASDGTPRVQQPNTMNPYRQRPATTPAFTEPLLNPATTPVPISQGIEGSKPFDAGFRVAPGGSLPSNNQTTGSATM